MTATNTMKVDRSSWISNNEHGTSNDEVETHPAAAYCPCPKTCHS